MVGSSGHLKIQISCGLFEAVEVILEVSIYYPLLSPIYGILMSLSPPVATTFKLKCYRYVSSIYAGFIMYPSSASMKFQNALPNL
jgi:hypothetical protein